jgi:divinyl chlorophyllide a 8-vinyl-reductase
MSRSSLSSGKKPIRVFMLGATGTIGRAVVPALISRGYDVVCFVRPGTKSAEVAGAVVRHGEVTLPHSIAADGLCGEPFDVLVSCLASRSGAPDDAWRIDHRAHVDALAAAKSAGVRHVVLLSAMCVQKPALAFQQAKLAFEKALIGSGLTYSIVRPTAFFKSLSGQIARVKQGKPFLLFGDGQLTACKPISDDDLAAFLADCITDPAQHNRILPIGGPGEAITPRRQGELLFQALGMAPRFRSVPLHLLDGIVALLSTAGRLIPAAARKSELARIGRYYATESMLVLDPLTGQYDAAMTPSTGADTLLDHYKRLASGEARSDLGVF